MNRNNIAIIFAGGIGSRMDHSTKPKQFLSLNNKPIIIYTIEKFEKCSQIDGIVIACRIEYIEYLKDLLLKFNIKKVKWIVPGGPSGQLSIFNALNVVYMNKLKLNDSVVLIHDGVRPIINNDLIIKNIQITRTKGNAITVFNATETIFTSHDGENVDNIIDRGSAYYARAPQTFFLEDIYSVHQKEMEKGIYNNIDSCSMVFKYGFKLNFVQCKSSNIKITTYEDYFIFKALSELEENKFYNTILK